MKKPLLLAAFLACATGAGAQTVADNSGENIPASALAALNSAAIRQHRDPDRTEFRELRYKKASGQKNIRGEVIANDQVCGLVNQSNEFGGMTGFQPFSFGTSDKQFLTADLCH